MLTLRAPPPRMFGRAGQAAETDLAGQYFEALWRHWSATDRALGLALSGAAGLGHAAFGPRTGWRRGWGAAEQRLLAQTTDPDAHLSMAARKGLHRLLNPGAYPLRRNPLKNKRLFAERCHAAGLPVPETFKGEPQDLSAWIGRRDAVIAKPNFASKGVGVIGFRRHGEGWLGGAEVMAEDHVLAALTGLLRAGGVVQESCATHPDLARLSPGALPTLRVMTAVTGDGWIAAFDTVLRLSAGGPRPVDNFNAGNIVAGVGPDGRIGCGFRRVDGAVVAIDRHPATGEPIAGHGVPDLTQAVELAVHAHEVFRDGFFVIGWDVGLTAWGPTLIEGNWNPGADILQLASGRGLGETPLGALYAERLRQLPAKAWRAARPIERDRR